MNDRFLIEPDGKRKKFDFFVIEKINSDYIFMIIIHSVFSDYINIEILEKENILILKHQEFISESSISSQEANQPFHFILPDHIETGSYFYNQKEKKIYLVFNKKKVNSLYQYYF